jgi:hypothetical protein
MVSPSYAADDMPIGAATPQTSRARTAPSVSENLASGFAEAAQAFSDEIVGTSNCGELAGNLVSGYLKANARFFEELANTSRRMTEDFTTQRSSMQSEADYARLADLVAARIIVAQSASQVSEEIDYDRLATLVAAKLAAKPQL